MMNSEASCCTITSSGWPSQSRSERTRPTGLKWAFSDSCSLHDTIICVKNIGTGEDATKFSNGVSPVGGTRLECNTTSHFSPGATRAVQLQRYLRHAREPLRVYCSKHKRTTAMLMGTAAAAAAASVRTCRWLNMFCSCHMTLSSDGICSLSLKPSTPSRNSGTMKSCSQVSIDCTALVDHKAAATNKRRKRQLQNKANTRRLSTA